MSKTFFSLLVCFFIHAQAGENHRYRLLKTLPGVVADKSLCFIQLGQSGKKAPKPPYLVATRYAEAADDSTAKNHILSIGKKPKVHFYARCHIKRRLSRKPPVKVQETEMVSPADPILYILDGRGYQRMFVPQGTIDGVSLQAEIDKDPHLKSAAYSADKSLLALGYVRGSNDAIVVLYTNKPLDLKAHNDGKKP